MSLPPPPPVRPRLLAFIKTVDGENRTRRERSQTQSVAMCGGKRRRGTFTDPPGAPGENHYVDPMVQLWTRTRRGQESGEGQVSHAGRV